MIEPRILKGFRDLLPEAMLPRERLIETAKQVYRSYGFVPIDTPVLEYQEILSGKGSEETDRQMYSFTDHGDRHVGMRFDLTVPLARFAAKHIGDLGTPFKRYQVGKVWRGESPQAGRYREFMQCDFDTIGTRSMAADIETGLVIYDLLRALGIEAFTISVNNRKVLNGVLEMIGIADRSAAVLRVLDKLDKIGADKVATELQSTAAADLQQVEQIMRLAQISGADDQQLSAVAGLVQGSEKGEQGLYELQQFVSSINAAGIDSERFQINLSLARGLDYYTGTVFETTLNQLPKIGSVCSGGRYDNLASLYTKQELPGIGASLGLDRLLTAMQELGLVSSTRTSAQVMIVQFDAAALGAYLNIATKLRHAGLGVELYPDAKKLGQQLKYADKKGFACAVIAGPDELEQNRVQLKWLATGNKSDVALSESCAEIIDAIQAQLN